jgi:hypothetical protein
LTHLLQKKSSPMGCTAFIHWLKHVPDFGAGVLQSVVQRVLWTVLGDDFSLCPGSGSDVWRPYGLENGHVPTYSYRFFIGA